MERIPFPTLSQTASPYQQLGQFLLLLGKKTDVAQNQKACLLTSAHPFHSRGLSASGRTAWMITRRLTERLLSACLNSRCDLDFCMSTWSQHSPRLSAGMAAPLAELKRLNGELIELQAAATVKAPERTGLVSSKVDFTNGTEGSSVRCLGQGRERWVGEEVQRNHQE